MNMNERTKNANSIRYKKSRERVKQKECRKKNNSKSRVECLMVFETI